MARTRIENILSSEEVLRLSNCHITACAERER